MAIGRLRARVEGMAAESVGLGSVRDVARCDVQEAVPAGAPEQRS